jgi:hypothetical protein
MLLGKCPCGQMSFWANIFLANVFVGKCPSGQMSSGQMSFWAIVLLGKRLLDRCLLGKCRSEQMSLGKCRMGKRRVTVYKVLEPFVFAISS